jgi:hypothetical protein
VIYPVPERLVPVRAEVRQRKVAAVLAILSAVLFVLAGFDVTAGSLSPFDLACFAGAALAAHLVTPLPLRR